MAKASVKRKSNKGIEGVVLRAKAHKAVPKRALKSTARAATKARTTLPKYPGRTKLRKILTYKNLPVIDAAEDLIFTATEIDKIKGVPGDPSHCVLACALMRELGAPEAEVGKSRTLIMSKDRSHWIRYRTSLAMRQQFIAGDQMDNKYFQLADYTLKAFVGVKRLGNGTQGTKTRPKDPKHKGKKRPAIKFKHNGVRDDVQRMDTIYVPA